MRESHPARLSQRRLHKRINQEARSLLRAEGLNLGDDLELYSLQSVRRYEGAAGGGTPSDVYLDLFERVIGRPSGSLRKTALAGGDGEPEELLDAVARKSFYDNPTLGRAWFGAALGFPIPDSVCLLLEGAQNSLRERVGPEAIIVLSLWIRSVVGLHSGQENPASAKATRRLLQEHMRPVEELSDSELRQLVLTLTQVADLLMGGTREEGVSVSTSNEVEEGDSTPVEVTAS